MSFDYAKGSGTVNCKYAYTLELRDRGDYGFIAPETEILPTCVEATAGVFAMAQALIPEHKPGELWQLNDRNKY